MGVKKLIDKILEIGTVISIMVMLSVVMIQVITRFALPKAPHWTEEVARICFIFTVSFGGGLAIRNGAFVNVDTFLNILTNKIKKFFRVFIYFIIFLFMVIIVINSINFIKIGSIQRSPSIMIPMSIPFSSMFILSFFIGFYSLIEIWKEIKEKEGDF